jgi:S-DNA-T family DNA segregation ATPase FtsK/SpoIIIE
MTLMLGPIPAWDLIRVYQKKVIAALLQQVFVEAGLKSKSGRFPQIISDWPIDPYVRRLRLTRAGLPEKQFKDAKATLESGLGVFIDEIKEHRESGLIDILYALTPMDQEVKVDDVSNIPENSFQIGMARAHAIFASLLEIPHFLIGGQSGGGKSTFLRQVIVTLYLRNPRMTFSLIDLKDRLEFGFCEGLKRVHVDGDVASAAHTLERVAQDLDRKTELLRTNGCKDFEAYQKVPKEKRKFPSGWPPHVPLERHMVIIDEAYGLFRVGPSSLAEDVQTARGAINKIAQKGRAVGVHLIVGTQRPDKNAVDPQTKANLSGRLCFKMADNASSMTILDNGRATDLPNIPGRAIWQSGLDNIEVQAPNLKDDKAKELIVPYFTYKGS